MAVELMPRRAQAGWTCPPSGLMEPLALLTYRPLLRKLDLRGATHLPGKLPQIVPPRVLSTQPITKVFIFYHHFHKFLSRDNLPPPPCPRKDPGASRCPSHDRRGPPTSTLPTVLMDTIQTWRVRTPSVESVRRWWESQFRSTCIYSSIT